LIVDAIRFDLKIRRFVARVVKVVTASAEWFSSSASARTQMGNKERTRRMSTGSGLFEERRGKGKKAAGWTNILNLLNRMRASLVGAD
jgi:hypothetical protein